MDIKVQVMTLGAVETNCYFVINNETKEVLIFDPADRADIIIDKINREGLTPKAILLTHGHFDHIMAVPKLQENYDIPVYAHEEEHEILVNPELNASFMIGTSVSMDATHFVKDRDVLELAGISIQVMHTPGHTKGGVCYYIDTIKKVICGDTLFAGSIGRTDLPTGSYSTIISAIQRQLFRLDDEVEALPGHGESTTIGYEKKYNPYAGIRFQ